MNISQIVLYRYAIPFTEPITVKEQRLTEREGIVISLADANGDAVGFGEIAPLPGLHNESIEQAENEIIKLLAQRTISVPCMMKQPLYPSVRTGLEIALLNLAAALSGNLPTLCSCANNAQQVPVNALLFGSPEEVVQRAEELFQAGYRTFKLKVNASNSAHALASINALQNRFGNSITLRLDANQSFHFDDAVAFGKALPIGSIAYIEEPLDDASRIGDFYAATAIPSALDETLWQHPELLESIPTKALAALVLRPSRLGGISSAEHFARYANEHGLLAVFSSAFESGISLGCYSWLAASCSAEPAACGLDTHRYLKHDLLTTPFPTDTPLLDASECYRDSLQVNLRALKRRSVWTL